MDDFEALPFAPSSGTLKLAYADNNRFMYICSQVLEVLGLTLDFSGYFSFDSMRIREVARQLGCSFGRHVEVFLRQHGILHFESIGDTNNPFDDTGWFRLFTEEESRRKLVLTEKELEWQYKKTKKRADTITTRMRSRKRDSGQMDQVPRGSLLKRIHNIEEVHDECFIVYLPNNVYTKKSEHRGYQRPLMYATEALQPLTENEQFVEEISRYIQAELTNFRKAVTAQVVEEPRQDPVSFLSSVNFLPDEFGSENNDSRKDNRSSPLDQRLNCSFIEDPETQESTDL